MQGFVSLSLPEPLYQNLFRGLKVNSDKVQNVGQGQNLDHFRTPLIWTNIRGHSDIL